MRPWIGQVGTSSRERLAMRGGSSIGILLLALAQGPAAREPSPARNEGPELVSGRVLTLADVLRDRGIVVDPAPAAAQAVLVTDGGEVRPLLLDDASRALFTDARLRGRPARIEARTSPGLPYLQVLTARVLEGDAFRTPEYWCDVCAISWRFDPELCPCCQGPMELRYKPASP